MVLDGWRVGTAVGRAMVPAKVWIDSGYLTPVVYAFCRETGQRLLPSIDRGAVRQHRQTYNRPTHTGSVVEHIGHSPGKRMWQHPLLHHGDHYPAVLIMRIHRPSLRLRRLPGADRRTKPLANAPM